MNLVFKTCNPKSSYLGPCYIYTQVTYSSLTRRVKSGSAIKIRLLLKQSGKRLNETQTNVKSYSDIPAVQKSRMSPAVEEP